jgi:hypothetical protein
MMERATMKLNEVMALVNHHLKPPFRPELVNSVEAALRMDSQTICQLNSLGDSELANVLRKRQPKTLFGKNERSFHEQTYFVRSQRMCKDVYKQID